MTTKQKQIEILMKKLQFVGVTLMQCQRFVAQNELPRQIGRTLLTLEQQLETLETFCESQIVIDDDSEYSHDGVW